MGGTTVALLMFIINLFSVGVFGHRQNSPDAICAFMSLMSLPAITSILVIYLTLG